MKLEHLRFLKDEIAKDLEGDTISFEVYYHFDSKWYLLDDPREIFHAELTALDKAEADVVAYHAPSSQTAWFSIRSLKSVVALKFSTSPQLATRKNYRERLTLVEKRAENSFKVSHNPLTLLLAKDAFYKSLTVEIRTSKTLSGIDLDESERSQVNLLGVLAFDIDYFKQINDTYGHLYGDQVLKVFAVRLESTAQDIEERSAGKVKVVLGHPSGEEFLAYISGNCSREDILAWAEQFRAKIADEILPSASEWDVLTARENLAMLQLPPQQERGVKASIGVSFNTLPAPNETGMDEAKFLLERADTALYRAKAGGRNQVVAFDSILETYGRVLEQDENTKIVAMDIGSNVGVALGQEFKVYSPNFTGQKKFQVNDGRTTRTLGIYPRVELTRITTFNVQRELSFAFISQVEDQGILIQSGSHLEAIPAGSIGHILPYKSKYFSTTRESVSATDASTLKDFLVEEASNGRPVFAGVLRFVNEQDYLRKYGAAALNDALTQLYRNALGDILFVSKAAALDASSVAIVGSAHSYNQEPIEDLIDEFYQDFPELGLVAGIYCQFQNRDNGRLAKLKLDPSYAIEFAQLAASPYGKEDNSRVTNFSIQSASRLLRRQYEARSYTSGQADFEKLLKLGVSDPVILNYGGLIYSKAGLKKQAAEQYEKAISLEPAKPIYKSNLGVVLNDLGEFERALKSFNSIDADQLPQVVKNSPSASLIYAVLLAKAKLIGDEKNFEAERFRFFYDAVMNYDDKFKSTKKTAYEVLSQSKFE